MAGIDTLVVNILVIGLIASLVHSHNKVATGDPLPRQLDFR